MVDGRRDDSKEESQHWLEIRISKLESELKDVSMQLDFIKMYGGASLETQNKNPVDKL